MGAQVLNLDPEVGETYSDQSSCSSSIDWHSAKVAKDLGYRQVQVIEATSGASDLTIRGFGMFSEFGGPVHGSTHTPASSMS